VFAVHALNEVSERTITIVDVIKHKEEYRAFLQALGERIGFDTDPAYVFDALNQWNVQGRGLVVFDNVRTIGQWNVLKQYDFTLVYIQTSRHQRVRRSGLSALDYTQAESHPIENNQELYSLASLVVDGTAAVEENVDKIKSYRVVEKVS
jgi:hypothetical protein